ncbi:PBP1A family penicillin-binding protein [Candidatus Nitrospira nitrificans]|uniref:Putative Penicillin-binding protein 1B n=1 Tax=Candidatus Nitrospira nitrificans TaxID=1742973 RepID=A0A0S4LG65_9BACT|nr:PBP1A family penicillin-binding protein [Candidatus Nitrospira nitrificans]CUS36239.1 putative Penicillin-binding protein 1B [Candidatus Nitrospira nitrificans]
MSTHTLSRSASLARRLFLPFLIVCGVAVTLVGGYVVFLSTSLALPKSDEHPPLLIYGAPFFLTPGIHAVDSGLLDHLQRLEYKPATAAPRVAGEYFTTKDSIEIFLHAQEEHRLPARSVRLRLTDGIVTEVLSVADGRPLSLVSLEPVLISGMRSGSRQVREWIPLGRVPPTLIKALLVIEDRRFFSHFGVDPIAIGRAFWINLTRGVLVQGGSTLTQQLAKNLYYSPKRTIGRKLREVMAAMALEFKYRKEEILESYVNEIYLGQAGPVSIYGVREAAHRYFSKDLDDLSIDEIALIIGLIKGPNAYSPVKSVESATTRRNVVLRRLKEEGILPEEAVAQAMNQPVKVMLNQDVLTDAPYFVDHLLREIEQGIGMDIPDGARIHSTLDPRAQRIVARVLHEGLAKLEKSYPALAGVEPPLQGAAVVLDVKTGHVLAMVGGRNYQLSQFNRAVQAHRSAGSLFKPFVYLAGFEAARDQGATGLTPATLLVDEPVTLESGTGSWSPQNYDRQYRGPVTVRTALEQSLNIPAVRTAHRTGMTALTSVLHAFGITTPLADDLSLALGSSSVSLLQITSAYAGLGNGGVVIHPVALSNMVREGGETIWSPPLDRRQAATPQGAFLMTSLLKGVVDRGTGAKARALGVHGPVAGKTGTTDGYRDAWFIGYTPEMAIGVWVGFDDERPLTLTGAQAALPIWSELALRLIPRDSPDFAAPAGVVQRKIDPKSGQLATSQCPEKRVEFFIAGTEPTVYCEVHGGGIWERMKQTFGLSQ